MRKWYCIYTNAGNKSALQIQSLLDRIQYEATLKVFVKKEQILRYNKPKFTNKPIFSSYLFIYTEEFTNSMLEQALIEAKLGKFLKLPHDDDHDLPSPISQEDIDHLKSLEEADVEPIEEEIIDVEVGNLVEVVVGPFMGVKGIVTQVNGHDVSVETLVFGRSTQTRFNISHLSKLQESYENKPAE